MNAEELENLGTDLIDDLKEALSDYDFVHVEGDGIESDCLTDTAMQYINVEWDWDDFYDGNNPHELNEDPSDYGLGDQLTDEIVNILDGVIKDRDNEITYDWDGSSNIVVALHVDDFEFE